MPVSLRFPKGFKTSIKESDPFEPGQVKALWESGQIPKGTLARPEGRAEWVPVNDLLRPAPISTSVSAPISTSVSAAPQRVATYGLAAETPPPPIAPPSFLDTLTQARPPMPRPTDFDREIEASEEAELAEEKNRKPKVPPSAYPRWLVATSMVLLVLCLVGLSFWAGYQVGCTQNQVKEAVAIIKNLADGPLKDLDLPFLKEEALERLKDDPNASPAEQRRVAPRGGPKASLIADNDDAPPVAPIPPKLPVGANPPFAANPGLRVIRNPRDAIELVDGSERIRLWNFSKTAKHFTRPKSDVPMLVLRCDFSVENLERNRNSAVRFAWNDLLKNQAAMNEQIRVSGTDEIKNPLDMIPWENDLLKLGARNLNPQETFVTPLRSSELAATAKELTITLTGQSGKTMTFGVNLVNLPSYRGQ